MIKKNKTSRISARVRPEVKARLERMAEEELQSITWILEDAILKRKGVKRVKREG